MNRVFNNAARADARSEPLFPCIAEHHQGELMGGRKLSKPLCSRSFGRTQPLVKASRMQVKHHGNIVLTNGLNQALLPAPRPISGCVNVNHVRLGDLVAAPAVHLLASTTVGPPFGPQTAGGVGREQFRLPSLRRESRKRVHHGCHAAWRVARSDMKHLAHESVQGLRGEESTHETSSLARQGSKNSRREAGR